MWLISPLTSVNIHFNMVRVQNVFSAMCSRRPNKCFYNSCIAHYILTWWWRASRLGCTLKETSARENQRARKAKTNIFLPDTKSITRQTPRIVVLKCECCVCLYSLHDFCMHEPFIRNRRASTQRKHALPICFGSQSTYWKREKRNKAIKNPPTKYSPIHNGWVLLSIRFGCHANLTNHLAFSLLAASNCTRA